MAKKPQYGTSEMYMFIIEKHRNTIDQMLISSVNKMYTSHLTICVNPQIHC